MGDGVDPLIRGAVGCAGSLVAGLTHGILDSTPHSEDVAPVFHYLVANIPPIATGWITAHSKYGLHDRESRIGAGVVSGGLAYLCTGAGYFAGRVIGEGVKTVWGLEEIDQER